MKSTLELGSRYVAPAIKRALVLELAKRGFTGTEIANMLGISPSLVSRYLGGERGAQIDLEKYVDVMEYVRKLANEIADRKRNRYEVAKEIDRITMYLMAKKYLCRIHAKLEPDVDVTKCGICAELFGELLKRGLTGLS